jgi:hypothetical protein
VKHGPYREWYPTGQLKAEVVLDNGVPNGPGTVWADSGAKVVEVAWNHGALEGMTFLRPEGGTIARAWIRPAAGTSWQEVEAPIIDDSSPARTHWRVPTNAESEVTLFHRSGKRAATVTDATMTFFDDAGARVCATPSDPECSAANPSVAAALKVFEELQHIPMPASVASNPIGRSIAASASGPATSKKAITGSALGDAIASIAEVVSAFSRDCARRPSPDFAACARVASDLAVAARRAQTVAASPPSSTQDPRKASSVAAACAHLGEAALLLIDGAKAGNTAKLLKAHETITSATNKMIVEMMIDEPQPDWTFGGVIQSGGPCPTGLWSLAPWVQTGANEFDQRAADEERAGTARSVLRDTYIISVRRLVEKTAGYDLASDVARFGLLSNHPPTSHVPPGTMRLGEYDFKTETFPLAIGAEPSCRLGEETVTIRLAKGKDLTYPVRLAGDEAKHLRVLWDENADPVGATQQSIVAHMIVRFRNAKPSDRVLSADVLRTVLQVEGKTVFAVSSARQVMKAGKAESRLVAE